MHTLRKDMLQAKVSSRAACSVGRVVLPPGGKEGQAETVDIHCRVPDQQFYNKTKRADCVPFQELYLESSWEPEAMPS